MSADAPPCLYDLPPEILEQIFQEFSADLSQLQRITNTCRKFRAVVSQVEQFDSWESWVISSE
jgi:hypothetical protein